MTETLPIELTDNNRTFKYHFTYLNVEQAEFGREAGEFRAYQLENLPETFNSVIKSGGADWLITICRYLIREYKNDSLLPFERIRAESDTDKFLRNLPITELPKLNEVVKDFFYSTGRENLGLMLLQNVSERKDRKTLLNALTTAIMNVEKSSKDK